MCHYYSHKVKTENLPAPEFSFYFILVLFNTNRTSVSEQQTFFVNLVQRHPSCIALGEIGDITPAQRPDAD